MFSCEFCEISKNTFTEHLWETASKKTETVLFALNHCLAILVCSEETQRKILESDIFRIPESKGVTEIGPLYKVSLSKFVLMIKNGEGETSVQRSNVVLAIQRSVLISVNELVLSEMGENLSL